MRNGLERTGVGTAEAEAAESGLPAAEAAPRPTGLSSEQTHRHASQPFPLSRAV